MNKRFQVFVSSTYEDLLEERNEVMHALLELNCIPAGMELFPAADEDQWTLIKRVIDDCDYYVVIIGGRYGSLHSSGKSYTQMEYEYAVSKNKPAIAFLHGDPDKIIAGKCETSELARKKLEKFRQLAKKKTVKYWANPADLGGKASRSILLLIQQRPAIGWIRSDAAVEELAAPELLRLRRQIEALEAKLAVTERAPEETEDLAQGDERLGLEFEVAFANDKGEVVWENEYSLNTTWNEMFRIICPYMLDGLTELEMQSLLGRAFLGRLRKASEENADEQEALKEHFSSDIPQVSAAKVREEDIKTIIVQFRALGLITSDEGDDWKLTPQGDKTMTRLRAIRRKQKPSTPAPEPNKVSRRKAK